MNHKQVAEVRFWDGLFNGNGPERFMLIRERDWEQKTKFFQPELDQETGNGLDLGNGLVSIFHFSKGKFKSLAAMDVLNAEYRKIFPDGMKSDTRVKYLFPEGETPSHEIQPFKDGVFDFVFCVNVIDHTPDPKRMVKEIHRTLKTGASFYFEVNFDDEMAPPHYDLWNEPMVKKVFSDSDWKLVRTATERNPNYPQSIYRAIFKKI